MKKFKHTVNNFLKQDLMDEQDKKIGLAMVGMLEERHENNDEEEEEDKFKHKYHGGFL